MLKAIIVDDEPLAREGMELNVEDVPYLELVGQFGNAMTANDFLMTNSVDLMFLDIHLPKVSGTEFLKMLKDPPEVIMTTAFSEYAIESYELEVLDYLLKPFSFTRFVKAVNKFNKKQELKTKLADSLHEGAEIFVKSGNQHIKISGAQVSLHRKDSRRVISLNFKATNPVVPRCTRILK